MLTQRTELGLLQSPAASAGPIGTDAAGSVLAIAVLVAASVFGGSQQMSSGKGATASAAPAASSAGPGTTTVPGEYVLAAYIGAPYTYPSGVSVKKTGQHEFTAHDVNWDAQPFKSPIYYGARVLKWFEGGRTGTMVDFTHSKALSRLDDTVKFSGTLDGKPAPEQAKLRDIFRLLEASHGHNMLTLNGLYRLPALSQGLVPYVGAGVGVSLPHSEVKLQTDKQRTYEYQMAGPVAQGLIGLEFRLPRSSVFIEYKFSWAAYTMPLSHTDGSILFLDLWRQAMNWLSGAEPPGGYLTTQYNSHQIIGGMGVRIVPAAAAP